MSLQSFETDVLADIRLWARGADHFIDAEFDEAWDLVRPILTAATPAEIGLLKDFIQDVLDDLPNVTDLATLETALLNSLAHAGAEELAMAKAIGSRILQALIAAVAAL